MSPVACRKPCRQSGCGILGFTPYCEKHTIKKEAEIKVERVKYDKERGTSASRGYGSRWTKYSLQYRINFPLCVMCEAKGKLTKADCVDHIIPVTGPDDPEFYNPKNHQGLCNTCHNIKSEAEGNRFNEKQRDRFI